VVAVVWVLAVALLACLVAFGITLRLLRDARREAAQLQETVEHQLVESRNPRAVQAAGRVVTKVVEAATRVREQGVGRMVLASIEDFTRWAGEQRSMIGRMAAPDGTVTIMFSDIEDSTRINSELGDDEWMRLLSAHDRLVEGQVDRHRGHVVKAQGDGYMVVFPTPQLALGAAMGIQRALSARRQRSRALRRRPLRVRIGLHTGIAVERDGDWFGRNVAMAARVAALADGGEVLVSDEVARRLTDEDGYEPVPTDPVELKGIPGEHTLWLVEAR
jgi:class 3 adenylate cyclase